VVSALESVGRRQAGVNWLRVAPNLGECRTETLHPERSEIAATIERGQSTPLAPTLQSRRSFPLPKLECANISLTKAFPL
jgi:hypothetical protein